MAEKSKVKHGVDELQDELQLRTVNVFLYGKFPFFPKSACFPTSLSPLNPGALLSCQILSAPIEQRQHFFTQFMKTVAKLEKILTIARFFRFFFGFILGVGAKQPVFKPLFCGVRFVKRSYNRGRGLRSFPSLWIFFDPS